MTPDETIECGLLMEKRDAGLINADEMRRLNELQIRARLELPTTETAIAAALRTDVEWQQRWGDLGRFLEHTGKDIAEVALKAIIQQIPTLLAGVAKK